MLNTFVKYFFKFIIKAKNRQRLLILAVAGLFLSSMALIILQSTMGGLQNNLMNRSKGVVGTGLFYLLADSDQSEIEKLEAKLKSKKISFVREYEIELMAKYNSYVTPVIVHGVDLNGFLPGFLKNENFVNGLIPMELAYKMEFLSPDELKLVSPSHTDSLFVDLPRSQTVKIDKTFSTDVPEIDMYHMWVRLPYIQNLVHSLSINRIRVYDFLDHEFLQSMASKNIKYKSWEMENSSLVWALNLESTVMVFLFAAMSLLVSLCITSGLLIFFNKIKNDLSSFWILGASLKKINRATTIFLHLMTLFSIVSGLVFGIIFLLLFKKYGGNIMPDVFVDRKIPVLITMKGLLISIMVPYLISFLFIQISLKQFKREYNLLDHVRSIS